MLIIEWRLLMVLMLRSDVVGFVKVVIGFESLGVWCGETINVFFFFLELRKNRKELSN